MSRESGRINSLNAHSDNDLSSILSNNNNENNENNNENNISEHEMETVFEQRKKTCVKKQIKSALFSIFTILVYFFFSICLTFYNRHLFVTYRYPLSITLIHLIFKFISATIIRCVLNCTKNRENKRITLDWYTYVTRILPTGIASAADIGLSNWSLEYITITLYTMAKSTVILFIFLFSIIFRLEKWHRSIILVVLCISTGLLLFTYHSTQFHLFGFSLVILASFSSGLRWTLAQVVTQKHELGLGNPIDMIYHIQPSMILCILPLAVYIEGLSVVSTDKFFRTDDFDSVLQNVLWIMFGAVLAFFLESSEFLVVSYTSSLTLSVSGIFKEVCVIYLAVVWNHNTLNRMNTLGLVLCIIGIVIHVFVKAKHQADLIKETNQHITSTTFGHRMRNFSLNSDSARQRVFSEATDVTLYDKFENSNDMISRESSFICNKKLAVRTSLNWKSFKNTNSSEPDHFMLEKPLLNPEEDEN